MGEAMQSYLGPEDDGLPMRNYGGWVAEKLHYVRHYINVFTSSMHGKPWRGMHYIDLFAGPGKCRTRDTGTIHLGSPLLALQTPHPFARYFFVDLQPRAITALEKRCSASPLRARIQFLVGDSNVLVREIVQQIAEIDRPYIPDTWHSLNLAFLDPEGLDLQWKTVETLASAKRMDLIIHYPEGGLNRTMAKVFASDDETAVDRFFGGAEWRKIYGKERNRRGIHRKLLDYYKGKLRQLKYEVRGGDEVGYEPLIRNVKKKAPLYRLIFASKDPLGNEFWEQVTRKDVYGQTRFLETSLPY